MVQAPQTNFSSSSRSTALSFGLNAGAFHILGGQLEEGLAITELSVSVAGKQVGSYVTSGVLQVAPLYVESACGQLPAFLCPFIVHKEIECGDQALVAVGMYNLAVAHHVLGVMGQESHLMQAKLAYGYAMDILDGSSLLEPHGSLINLYLAICLNMANLLSTVDNGKEESHIEWEATFENAFRTIVPNLGCPVYRYFARRADA